MKKTYPYIISSFLYKSIIILVLEFDCYGIGEVWKIYRILDVSSSTVVFSVFSIKIQRKLSLFFLIRFHLQGEYISCTSERLLARTRETREG